MAEILTVKLFLNYTMTSRVRSKLYYVIKHSILEKKVREKNADTSQIEA